MTTQTHPHIDERFLRRAALNKGASVCPFLSQRDLEFLQEVRNRTDGNMYESCVPEMNEVRDRFLAVGYNDETHARFLETTSSPETMDRDELLSFLSVIYIAYYDLREDRKKTLAEHTKAYKKMREVTYVGETGASGEFADAFRRCCHDVSDYSGIVRALDNVVERLASIINPALRAEVVEIRPRMAAQP